MITEEVNASKESRRRIMTGGWGEIKLCIDGITKNKANSVSEGKNGSRFLGCCVVLHGEGIATHSSILA